MAQLNPTSVSPQERIEILDIIRGFALFGVLLVNMSFFKSLLATPPKSPLESTAVLDQLAAWLILLLAEGKFFVIFSFLFGLGFYIFMERTEMKGLDIARLYKRRLWGLLIIGAVHLIFIWAGDILFAYSIAGFFLLLFRKRKDATLRKWIAILLSFTAISIILLSFLNFLILKLVGEEAMLSSLKEMAFILQTGTYAEILASRFSEALGILFINTPFAVFAVLPLFLMGFYAGKKQIFRRTTELLASFQKVRNTSFLAGVFMSLLFIVLEIVNHGSSSGYGSSSWLLPALSEVLKYFTGIMLGTFYVSSLVLLYTKDTGRKIIQPLAYVGKMALTNYLMQSIICVLIFYGFGLGMFGQLTPFEGLLLAITIFAGQIIFSSLWLKRYAFGPFEWVWRMFTYKRRFAIKRS